MAAKNPAKNSQKSAHKKGLTPAIEPDREPHRFEPLLPQKNLAGLREQARAVLDAASRLSVRSHDSTRTELRELVRAMNSYYSNRIEGQGTHPRNIERALSHHFSNRPDIARLQRLAMAHIEAEKELESRVADGARVLSSAFALEAHRALYGPTRSHQRRWLDGRTRCLA